MTNAFTPERLATIASELSAKTGRAWSATINEERDSRSELCSGPLRIGLMAGWNGNGKTHAYADMTDKDPAGYTRDHYAHKAPSIDFSTAKDAAKIAGDLARRLVPDADAWAAHELESRARYIGNVDELEATIAAIARAWTVPAPGARQYEPRDRERHLSTIGHRVTATAGYGGHATFKIGARNAAQAERIARVLLELDTAHQAEELEP